MFRSKTLDIISEITGRLVVRFVFENPQIYGACVYRNCVLCVVSCATYLPQTTLLPGQCRVFFAWGQAYLVAGQISTIVAGRLSISRLNSTSAQHAKPSFVFGTPNSRHIFFLRSTFLGPHDLPKMDFFKPQDRNNTLV